MINKEGANIINKVLIDNGLQSYYVGGCVRDIFLGKTPHDYDFATNGIPDMVYRALYNSPLIDDISLKGKEFGTIVGIIGDNEYEITTFRKDGAYNGHKPESVSFSRTIKEDLSRRDFTINAMAIDGSNGKLIDPFKGKDDIDKKTIRTVGDANKRFSEDPLRILRAMRFAITLGFDIDGDTKVAMNSEKDGLKNISKERITEELKKIFKTGKDIAPIFMEFRDILAVCIPELKPCFDFEQNNKYHKHDVYEHSLYVTDSINNSFGKIPEDRFIALKFAALFHDIGKPDTYSIDDEGLGHFYGHPANSGKIFESICNDRLSFTNKEKTRILNLIQSHDVELTFTEKSVRRMLNTFPDKEFIEDLCILKRADREDHINFNNTIDFDLYMDMVKKEIEKQSCFSLKDLFVNGHDIMALGFKGREVGNILNNILSKVIDGDLLNNKDAIMEYVSCEFKNKDIEYIEL